MYPPPQIQSGCRLMAGLVFDTLLLFAVSCVALMGVPQLWPEDQEQDQESSSQRKLPGFFCSDSSLNYPPSHEEPLVGGLHKTFIVVVVPSVLIVALEMFRAAFETSFGQARPKRLYYFLGVPVPTFVSECYKAIGVYYFGLALQHILGELTRSQVTRLRPSFLADCQPQMADGSTCKDAANQGRFIEDYVCSTASRDEADSEEFSELLTGSNQPRGEDYSSFPCLMVSAVAYAMTFVIVYMQARLKDGHKFRTLLQFIAFMVVVVVAIEPVTSHRNHLGDIVAGCLIGLACGLFVALAVAQLWQSTGGENVYADVAVTSSSSWADKHGPLPMVPAVAAPYSYTPAKQRRLSQTRRNSNGLYSRHYRQVRPTSRPTYESYYDARGYDYGYARNTRHY